MGTLANWDLRLTDAEKSAARFALGQLAGMPLMVCGPGTKMQAKDWGQENWRALLADLAREYSGFGLALIGANEDAEVSDYAAADWAGPCVNLCGKLSPRETAAVLAGASVFLGPDSGPMHLAACFGVPCVIAFSARGLPGVWYPAGAGSFAATQGRLSSGGLLWLQPRDLHFGRAKMPDVDRGRRDAGCGPLGIGLGDLFDYVHCYGWRGIYRQQSGS